MIIQFWRKNYFSLCVYFLLKIVIAISISHIYQPSWFWRCECSEDKIFLHYIWLFHNWSRKWSLKNAFLMLFDFVYLIHIFFYDTFVVPFFLILFFLILPLSKASTPTVRSFLFSALISQRGRNYLTNQINDSFHNQDGVCFEEETELT